MLFSRSLAVRALSLAAALAFISVPSLMAVGADTLVASDNPVNFYYSGDPRTLEPRTVAITLEGEPATVTGIQFTSNPSGIFLAEYSGSNVRVGVNRGALTGVTQGIFEGVLQVNAGPDGMNLVVRLTIGSASFSLEPALLQFQAAPGSTTEVSQTVTIVSDASDAFTASASVDSGSGWLSVSPVSGVITPPGTNLEVTVDPTGLTTGTYAGSVTVTVGETQQTVSVSLQVGGAGGLSFNPPALSFSYSTTLGQAPAAQNLTVSSTAATQFTAYPVSSGWLLVNGASGTTGWVGAPGTLSVTVNPTGLSAGLYQGSIQIQGNDGSSGTVNVALTVDGASGAVTVSPTSLEFVGTAPEGRQISISSTASGTTWTATTSQPWLTLSQTSGVAPDTIFAYVNSAGLANTIYTAYITFTFSGGATGTRQIFVTYAPGGTGGTGPTAAVPSSLVFSIRQGSTAQVPFQEIAIVGTSGAEFTATVGSATGGNWLGVAGGGTVPAKVTITVNSQVASTLAAGQYTGAVVIQSGTGTINVGVTLHVKESPVLVPNPGSLTFIYDPASGMPPGMQYVGITRSGVHGDSTNEFQYAAISSADWIQLVYGAGGTTPGAIGVALNVSALPPGVSAGNIVVTAPGAANSPLTIPVTVAIPGGEQTNIASPSSLRFTAAAGQTSAPQTLNVTGVGGALYSVSSNVSWLSMNPATGNTPGTVTVTANAAGLVAGTHTGTITVIAGTLSQQVPVTFTVGTVSAITLTVGTLSSQFQYQQGAAVPPPKDLEVSSSGGPVGITATASSTGNWLMVIPDVAPTPATLSVSVNPEGLAPGTYTGTITVTAQGVSNSPQTHTVTLTVTAPPMLTASPALLNFSFRTDGPEPGPQTVTVGSTGGALPFIAEADAAWIEVSPATDITPGTLTVSVKPAGLGPGNHTGRITLSSSAAAGLAVVEVGLTVTASLPTITGIGNAASYQGGAVAPGEIVTIFGTSMGPADLVTHQLDSSGRMATTLSDVRVLFNGMPAPLVYVSATQVSAIVPYVTAGRQVNSVWLEYRGVRSNAVTVNGATALPGLFTANASGTGPGAILNQDYSLNSAANAAARGSVVMLYVTGEGQTIPGGVDGHINNDPNQLPRPVLPVTVTIGGRPATVHYAGAAPDMVSGLMQVNAEIPADAPVGQVPVVVSVGGVSSQQGVTIAVR